jgi:hypothetical protein
MAAWGTTPDANNHMLFEAIFVVDRSCEEANEEKLQTIIKRAANCKQSLQHSVEGIKKFCEKAAILID